jgi:hypothetical protein
MMKGGHELEHALEAVRSESLVTVTLWLLPALLAGGMAWLLPKRFDGAPIPSLRSALLAGGTDERPTRPLQPW